LVERLADRLADADYLADLLRGLSPDEQAILLEARRAGGELRGLLVERNHPAEADTLVDRGLLFRVFTTSGPRRGEIFAIADQLPPSWMTSAPGLSSPADGRWMPAGSLFGMLRSARVCWSTRQMARWSRDLRLGERLTTRRLSPTVCGTPISGTDRGPR